MQDLLVVGLIIRRTIIASSWVDPNYGSVRLIITSTFDSVTFKFF